MGFAEDKVYDHIMKNLKNFKNIRVASLADSLSCLTDADRVIPASPSPAALRRLYVKQPIYVKPYL